MFSPRRKHHKEAGPGTTRALFAALACSALVCGTGYSSAVQDDQGSRTCASIQSSIVQVIARTELSAYLEGMLTQMGRPVRFHHGGLSASFSPLWKRRLGAGVVLTKDGEVLTPWSVVRQGQFLDVRFLDGTLVHAELVAANPRANMALLRIPGAVLTPAELNPNDPPERGEPVDMLALSQNGKLVSVRGTVVERLLLPGFEACPVGFRVLAPIPPGASGGPCIDSQGYVCGFVSGLLRPERAKDALLSGEGFSTLVVPVPSAMRLVQEMRNGVRQDRGWFGIDISLEPSREEGTGASGARVIGVPEGGPASLAGMRPGDRIEAMDGRAIRDPMEMIHLTCGVAPGQVARFLVDRGGKKQRLRLTAAAKPSETRKSLFAIPKEGCLGLRIQELDRELRAHVAIPSGMGVLVAQVQEGSAAGRAGIRPGDVLLELAGRDVGSVRQVGEISRGLRFCSENETAFSAVVYRDGRRLAMELAGGSVRAGDSSRSEHTDSPGWPVLEPDAFGEWLRRKAALDELSRRWAEELNSGGNEGAGQLEDGQARRLVQELERQRRELEDYLKWYRSRQEERNRLRLLSAPE